MEKKQPKICFISSAGGHFEQSKQLNEIKENYECYDMVTRTKATEQLQDKRYIIINLERRNPFIFLISLGLMTLQQFIIFLIEKPDVIITTGAGVVIPTCLIAKLFRRKVVYIESFARVSTPNKTGLFLYKFADLFIIQWEELRPYYRDAVYGGGIY